MKRGRFKEPRWKIKSALRATFWKPKELLLEISAAHVNRTQHARTISQPAKHEPNSFQRLRYFLNLFCLGKVTPVCQKGSAQREAIQLWQRGAFHRCIAGVLEHGAATADSLLPGIFSRCSHLEQIPNASGRSRQYHGLIPNHPRAKQTGRSSVRRRISLS